MPVYYHLAPLPLGPGSIIEPGNWGRMLNCYLMEPGATQTSWRLARELAFETVRAQSFSHLPSRLSCAFVFEELPHAIQYRDRFSRWSAIYSVELVTPAAASHRAAFNLIDYPPPGVEFLPYVVSKAIPYWRGEAIETPEVLTKSPLRIRALEVGPPGAYQP